MTVLVICKLSSSPLNHFNLNDYSFNYKSRLLHLKLFPLMYIFEISDIIFLVKSLKFPSISFNINHYISFSTSGTQSSGTKLLHNIPSTNKHRNHYFNRIYRLWNAIDLNMSMQNIKKFKRYSCGTISVTTLIHQMFALFTLFIHAALSKFTSTYTFSYLVNYL